MGVAWDKFKQTTVCECGTTLQRQWLDGALVLNDAPKGFLGNTVKARMRCRCKECGRFYDAALKPDGNSYKIVGIVLSDDEMVRLEERLKKMSRTDLVKEAAKYNTEGQIGQIVQMKSPLLISKILELAR